ncbi:MAG: cytochrome c-type biogenesis protein CcmH [Acidobacteriia bacterium]|nr:cytochrome c-type biogenesis protein CcmH [Terriglobia bacterium]
MRDRYPVLSRGVRYFFVALTLALLSAFSLAQTGSPRNTSPKTTLDEVSDKLSCRCGCNLVLNRCNHVQCGSAIPMRERINKEIAEGKTRDEIVAGFVRDFGQEVLAVPPTSGFNWNAWIMPFAALGVGIILVLVALKIMLRRRTGRVPVSVAAGDHPTAPAADPRHADIDSRIEKELKEFED